MKNKFISRLLLLVVTMLILFSCRNNDLTENEIPTYNNSSAFQYTSKRISLSESKHKAKLLPTIEKVGIEINKNSIKKNVSGKVISYGNGVTIDTDKVLYIEDGTGYYTYTFSIQRTNAPENAPLENLVLSPLADGSYKEVLVSYNLSLQEKKTLINGGYVDTKGRTTITELGEGATYSPLSREGTSLSSCGWTETYTLVGCSDVHNGISTHNENNISEWESCQADRKPGLYMTMTYRCDFAGMTDGEGSGASSGSGVTDGMGTIPAGSGIPTQAFGISNFALFAKNLPINATFYDVFNTFYDANYGSDEAKAFIKKALQADFQNTITVSQFENWFLIGYSQQFHYNLASLSISELQDYASINQEIDTSSYDEETIKETNEAFVAFTAYGDIDTLTEAEIQSVLNQCCPNLILIPQNLIVEKTKLISLNYKALRNLYPQWSKAKCLWEASRETIQLLLDIGGAFPLIGEVCDITNGAIYAMNGDALNSALSFSAAIPVAGWGATVSKYAVKTVHLANGAKTTLKFLRRLDGVVTFGNRAQLRRVLGLAKGDLRQAHHIIPWELFNNPAIQKASLSSKAFHMNEALNGIPLNNVQHYGSHANYTNLVEQRLDDIPSNYTPNQVYDEIMDIIHDIRTAINNHPNTPINQLVF